MLLMLIAGFCRFSYADNRPLQHAGDSSRFNIHIKWNYTNAIHMSETTVMEQINGKYVSVKEFTFTIPFFEKMFRAKLDCINTPPIAATSLIVPTDIPPPCKQSEFKLYNDFSSGQIVGNVDRSMTIKVHDFTAAIGSNSLRAEAFCKGSAYARQYFRIIVKQEAAPSVTVQLVLNDKKVPAASNTKIEEQQVHFNLAGEKTTNKNLFVKIIPPCGTECRRTDYNIDEVLGNADESFYACDMDGVYEVKLIYKAPRVGSGDFNTTVEVPGWNHYSFLHASKAETAVFAKEQVTERLDKIAVHPNPVQDFLFVNLPAMKTKSISHVQVLDMAGQVVLVQETNSAQFKLNFSSLPKGAYVIRVKADQQTFTEKVIKL